MREETARRASGLEMARARQDQEAAATLIASLPADQPDIRAGALPPRPICESQTRVGAVQNDARMRRPRGAGRMRMHATLLLGAHEQQHDGVYAPRHHHRAWRGAGVDAAARRARRNGRDCQASPRGRWRGRFQYQDRVGCPWCQVGGTRWGGGEWAFPLPADERPSRDAAAPTGVKPGPASAAGERTGR